VDRIIRNKIFNGGLFLKRIRNILIEDNSSGSKSYINTAVIFAIILWLLLELICAIKKCSKRINRCLLLLKTFNQKRNETNIIHRKKIDFRIYHIACVVFYLGLRKMFYQLRKYLLYILRDKSVSILIT